MKNGRIHVLASTNQFIWIIYLHFPYSFSAEFKVHINYEIYWPMYPDLIRCTGLDCLILKLIKKECIFYESDFTSETGIRNMTTASRTRQAVQISVHSLYH